MAFQSTCPVWGRTRVSQARIFVNQFQSTCPVWGRTPSAAGFTSWRSAFQSTCPVWGRTALAYDIYLKGRISIHLPRVGQDGFYQPSADSVSDFNPPAPSGAGPGAIRQDTQRIRNFNPPAPSGQDRRRQSASCGDMISIHLPRVGRTPRFWTRRPAIRFQSTCPEWAGLHKFTKNSLVIYATQTNRSVCVRSWQNSMCTVLP